MNGSNLTFDQITRALELARDKAREEVRVYDQALSQHLKGRITAPNGPRAPISSHVATRVPSGAPRKGGRPPTYPPELRAKALARADEIGPAATARELGMSVNTVHMWRALARKAREKPTEPVAPSSEATEQASAPVEPGEFPKFGW